jgi:hypothetical protein
MRDYIYEIYCLANDIHFEEVEETREEMIEELRLLIVEYQSF